MRTTWLLIATSAGLLFFSALVLPVSARRTPAKPPPPCCYYPPDASELDAADVSPADAGSDGGASEEASDSGATVVVADSGGSVAETDAAIVAEPDDSGAGTAKGDGKGCSCALAGRRTDSTGGPAVLLAIVLMALRRRVRASSRR